MGLHVLCIDNDTISRIIMRRMMRILAFADAVNMAKDGTEALQKIAQMKTHPHLIFLDLDAPMLDAWRFLEAYDQLYQQQFPHTRIALFSSSIDPNDEVKVRRFDSVMGLFIKPVTIELLQHIKARL